MLKSAEFSSAETSLEHYISCFHALTKGEHFGAYANENLTLVNAIKTISNIADDSARDRNCGKHPARTEIQNFMKGIIKEHNSKKLSKNKKLAICQLFEATVIQVAAVQEGKGNTEETKASIAKLRAITRDQWLEPGLKSKAIYGAGVWAVTAGAILIACGTGTIVPALLIGLWTAVMVTLLRAAKSMCDTDKFAEARYKHISSSTRGRSLCDVLDNFVDKIAAQQSSTSSPTP